MLTDAELERLLGEAAASFDVPPPVLEVPVASAPPVWKRKWPMAAAASVVLLCGAVLATGGFRTDHEPMIARVPSGFAGGSSSDSAGEAPASGGLQTGGTTGGTTGASAPLSPASGVGARPPSAVGGSAAKPVAPVAADGARVVKTGEVSLLVDEGKVGATVRRLQALVAGSRGYVASSESEEASESPRATLTVRVPVGSFDALVEKVRGLPVTVLSASSSGKDVTAAYADTQAQIQSLQAARARYLVILSRARTIGETLTVQQRVDEVQQQIDRLEGQRRVLADTSDYGTLTLSVAEDRDEVLTAEEPSGWSRAWDDAKHGFTSGVQSIIGGSGRALLALLVIGALAVVGRGAWRLARRRLV